MTPRVVSWEEFYSKCDALAEAIVQIFRVSAVGYSSLVLCGIQRGGAIVANVLSYIMESKYDTEARVVVAGVRRYAKETRVLDHHSPVVVYEHPSSPEQGVCLVVVDDISSTGITLQAVKSRIPDKDVWTATIFASEGALPEIFCEKIPDDVWVFFPWDSKEELYESSSSVDGR